jgi:Domain of unknown function (DUF4411)
MPDDVSVIDTSSILQVRRIIARQEQQGVYDKLTVLVQGNSLFFPKEVVVELERWSNPDPSSTDLPLEWVKANSHKAAKHGVPFDALKLVLEQVQEVHDPDKLGVEEADPYVLALAIHLQQQGKQVMVLTEERKDRPDKISMTTAYGVLRLPCLPVHMFLRINGIWQATN